ncbi:MAG: hypothetical protein JWL60_767 [Gemmatimonadetes bacterium]|jgi:hypothetical protein|nr:hypothetical protein [Gemmatimonadota bacterium]
MLKRHRFTLLLLAVFLPFAGCVQPTRPDWAVLVIETRMPDGTPVPGVRVERVAEGDTAAGSIVTGNGGSHTEIGIRPGLYHLTLRQPPTGYQVPGTQPNPVRVVVVQGQESVVRFTLVRT